MSAEKPGGKSGRLVAEASERLGRQAGLRAAESSFHVGNVASHSPDFLVRQRSSRRGSGDGVAQFVGGGGGAGAAQVDVPVVDAPVVNQSMIAVEHGYLGSDLHPA